MKTYLETILLGIFLLFVSCSKQNDNKSIEIKKDITFANNRITKSPSQDVKPKKEEENENDGFISYSLFKIWKGKYRLKQENQTDGWGRESISFSELLLIKPDSCIFKSWLSDSNGKRFSEDDNYQEFIGVIYATPNKDSIEFYTKKVVSGESSTLTPLLTLTKKNNNYFIYSLITSPPHNGIIEMPIEKE